MHNEERHDNGPRSEATPVHIETKRSKVKPVLLLLAGLLVAGLLFSVGSHSGSRNSHMVGLVPVMASGADLLRFDVDGVSTVNVTTRNGSVDVRMHSGNYIGVQSTSGTTHEADDGAISLNSRNGSFTILLPDGQNTLSNLTINTRNGSISISGVAGSNAVLARNLDVETRNGGIWLTDLAAPGSLEAETRNGSINLSNVYSDESSTRLHTRNGRINAN